MDESGVNPTSNSKVGTTLGYGSIWFDNCDWRPVGRNSRCRVEGARATAAAVAAENGVVESVMGGYCTLSAEGWCRVEGKCCGYIAIPGHLKQTK